MPRYQLYSDDDLCTLLRNGDHMAYTEIYNRYSGVLYIHTYRRLRSRDEARDLIHELFTTLWVRREQIILKTSLSSYLYKAASNRVIDLVMRKKREILYSCSFDKDWELNTGNADHAMRESELRNLIDKEIEALPEKMKIVFNMSRKGYLSHREISEELEISELTVRKQINNALKILKPRLSKFMMLFF
jgi:RNA polymerase sigma-70 factor (family 1)